MGTTALPATNPAALVGAADGPGPAMRLASFLVRWLPTPLDADGCPGPALDPGLPVGLDPGGAVAMASGLVGRRSAAGHGGQGRAANDGRDGQAGHDGCPSGASGHGAQPRPGSSTGGSPVVGGLGVARR